MSHIWKRMDKFMISFLTKKIANREYWERTRIKLLSSVRKMEKSSLKKKKMRNRSR